MDRIGLFGRIVAVAAVLFAAGPVVALAQAAGPAPAPTQTGEQMREAVRQWNKDVGRIASPHGVDQAGLVTLGGAPQWVAVRGQDRRQRILLFLHGGPADPISPEAYIYQRPWEDFFTVVNWDQRGAGRSAGELSDRQGRKGAFYKAQLISDAIELIDILRHDYDQPKIILVGQSWGTVLALEIAHRRPDLLYAVVVQGLATQWIPRAEVNRQSLIAAADARGDTVQARKLRAVGPLPPASDPEGVYRWLGRLGAASGPKEQLLLAQHFWYNEQKPTDTGQRLDFAKFVSPDLSPEDYQKAKDQAAHATPAQMMARFQDSMAPAFDWDAEKDVGTRFEVPVIVMMGHEDWTTPYEMARAYYAKVCAPYKMFVDAPYAAHVFNAEQPGRSVVALVNDVLPAVTGEVPKGAEVCAIGSRR